MITGQVSIRDQEVVKWEARPSAPSQTFAGRWDYLVTAYGWMNGRKFDTSFFVPHDRNAGPYMLTSIIMVELMNRLDEDRQTV